LRVLVALVRFLKEGGAMSVMVVLLRGHGD